MNFINTLRFSILTAAMFAQAASAAILNIGGNAEDYDGLGSAVAAGDFNCDGYDDLAAGAPGESIDGLTGTGVINVVYGGTGSGGMLGTTGNHYIQDATPESHTGFGGVLAAADFDGDGCDDLAVGIPGKDVGGIISAGEVTILYGHYFALGYGGPEVWNQNTVGVADTAEDGDYFGGSLTAGDFNGDGYMDLAIGIYGEDNYAGAVYVMHGQPLAGLVALASKFFTQNSTGIADTAEAGDQFGRSLTSGDFDNNGYDDLAIGVPYEAHGTIRDAGGVHVLYSTSSTSLSGSGSQWWHQDSSGIANSIGASEEFGYSLAAGNFDNHGGDDLAIGVPNEGFIPGGCYMCSSFAYGAVHVLYGSQDTGLGSSWNQFFRADDAGIPVSNNADFGWSLTVGRFNNDDNDDLAIGAPRDFFSEERAGSVYVLYGDDIFSTSSSHYRHQNVSNVEGVAEWYDEFGRSLATGDFNNDGRSDLVVGIPREVYEENEGGAVQVFYGSSGGVSTSDHLLVQ